MIGTRKFLLSAMAAISVLAVAAPASFASTTVEPAGQEVTGSANNFSFTIKPGVAFKCLESTITALVPAKPANTAKTGPVNLAMAPPALGLCWAESGGVKIPPTWWTTAENGPWSLGAEVGETQTFLNLRTSPGGIVVGVGGSCVIKLFPNGDELQGKFNNASATVEYNEPASYDGTKCGLGTGTGTFVGTYKFSGLSITP